MPTTININPIIFAKLTVSCKKKNAKIDVNINPIAERGYA